MARKIYSFILVVVVLVVSVFFVLAASYNEAPVNAGNGTIITMLIFNVSNASSVSGTALNNITINLTGTASVGNITNVTVSNGTTVWYTENPSSSPFNVSIGSNITAETNFTINFTINSTATDALTLQANVTHIYNETNVSYSVLPYVLGPTTIDSLKPYIQYESTTTEATNLSQSYIFVNITANDTVSNLSTLIIYLYNSTGEQNSSTNDSIGATSVVQTYNFSGLSDGTYYINATVNDSYNHVNTSLATITIILDITVPNVVAFNTPANNANLSSTQVLNVTVNDTTLAVDTVFFNVSNGTQQVWSQATNPTGDYWNATLNTSALADGNYNITVYANDTLGNLNSSEYITITVDNTVPNVVEFNTPANTANLSSTQVLNVTVNDTTLAIDTVFFNVSNSSGGVLWSQATNSDGDYWNATLNTSALADGDYNITVYANDTLGNLNSSEYITVTVDNTNSVITLIVPADSTSSTTSAYNFTFNVTDDQTVSNCSLIFDGSVIHILTSINNTGGTNGMYNSSLSVATYTWSINCTDVAGNVGNSSTRTLIVSAAPATSATSATDDDSSSGGGGTGTPTYHPTDEKLGEGYTLILRKDYKVEFVDVSGGESHTLNVDSIGGDSVQITVSSEPQTKTLSVGDEVKFELDGDNVYDFSVKLKSISGSSAELLMKTISEEMLVVVSDDEIEDVAEGMVGDDKKEISGEETVFSLWWIGLIIAIVVVGVVVYFKKR